jgi:cytoskeletal protein RodZ
MKSWNQWLGRVIALSLTLLLSFPASEAGSAMAQQAPETGSQSAQSAPVHGSNSTQAARAGDSESSLPEAPVPASPRGPAGPQTAAGQQAADRAAQTAPPQEAPHRPVGAAAAPYEPTMGIAASRPAGAAIAPAKQRRVRTILISLGVVAGAAIAVGSVAALSHGSPSRP